MYTDVTVRRGVGRRERDLREVDRHRHLQARVRLVPLVRRDPDLSI